MSEITEIRLTPLHVPFKQMIREVMAESGGLGMAIPAEEDWLGGDFVICELIAASGEIGLGEAFVWLPETGISPAQIIELIEKSLSHYILGESPFNVQRIRQRMDANVARSEVAKGLLDMACYDLMGQITGRPAYDFMGGKIVDEVPLAALIPLADVETMVAVSQMFHNRGKGYMTMRVKLGRGPGEDARIVETLRDATKPETRFRVDYNQAYRPPAAVQAIRAIESYGIDIAEQPVAAGDALGMKYVQERVNTPLMAHEGCFSLEDITTLVELGAVEVIGINSERPGGVTRALMALDYAEMRGLTAVIHNQPLGISTAMEIQLAAARHHQLGHATELFGDVMLEDDLLQKGLQYGKGVVKVPEGPGWGVELDRAALDKYATSTTTFIRS